MVIVYIYMKLINRDIFYVGIGNDISCVYCNEGRNDYWIKIYKKYGKIVDIVVFDISFDVVKEIEKYFIVFIGMKLFCNKIVGGEGFFGGKYIEEMKEKFW